MNFPPPLETWMMMGELNLAAASRQALAVEELDGEKGKKVGEV
jgi:hypothetical protein